MILHCNTLSHPLTNRGTRQSERLLAALLPDQLKLDDRSIEDLIAFAGTLAPHVQYWDAQNTATGDWLPFWQSDDSALLAIIAATDLDTPRTDFRSAEIEYLRLKQKEDQGLTKPGDPAASTVIDQMVTDPVFGVYGLALAVLKICSQVPVAKLPNPPGALKTEIVNLISSTLKDPLYRLVQFHKSIDPEAIKKYAGFIGTENCAAPWGMPDNASFECINFVKPDEFREELWKLFLAFYKALKLIINKARKAFQASLRNRHDHQPHITLFIAFLYLFKHLQDDLNGLNDKHLQFYYHDVLQLERRRIIPDKVHIVFEIAANLVRYRIEKGTGLKAGQDEKGLPMTYSLADELVISNATLAEKKNLYVKEGLNAANIKTSFAIALPAADMRDGIDEPWPEGTKAWMGLSGMPVYERFAYKDRQLKKLAAGKIRQGNAVLKKEIADNQAHLQKLQAFSGFSISSASFWLNKGLTRVISLNFNVDQDNLNFITDYIVEIATDKGLVELKPHPFDINPSGGADMGPWGVPESAIAFIHQLQELVQFGPRPSSGDPIPPDPTFQSYCRIVRLLPQRYLIVLTKPFPSVVPGDNGTPPFIRFRNRDAAAKVSSAIQSVEVFSAAQGSMGEQELHTRLFRNTDGVIQSGTELVLVRQGFQAVYINFPELFAKGLLTLEIDSTAVPVTVPLTKSILNAHQWVATPLPAAGLAFTEIQGPLSAPDFFDFSTPIAGVIPNQDGWIKIEFTLPAPAAGSLFTPVLVSTDDFFITYKSVPVLLPQNGFVTGAEHHFISSFTSLGDWIPDQDSNQGILPSPAITQPGLVPLLNKDLFNTPTPSRTANGNLFLGFQNLVANQTLSVLFKTAPGTGNPDYYAPTIVWSYLRSNKWIAFPPQFILRDTTLGMEQTGIILFQIPGDINNGNTWIKGAGGRTDLYWLRASAVEIPEDLVMLDALPFLKDVYVNAAEADFTDDNNTEDHLETGIPAGTIADLNFRDVNVKTVTQPYASFGGSRSEQQNEMAYLRRIHERLRHKNRAVTSWDYERLVLEAWPGMAVAKCLTHTRRVYTARPGQVTMAVIPNPKDMVGNRVYYPIFDAGDLTAIHNFLNRRNSYFVGGYGDPAFCCCDDGCKCEHHIDGLQVINARFEPIRFKVCVRFYEGKDIPFYTKQLNEALKNFLSPWALQHKPPQFGIPVSLTRLLQFLENLDYVDVIMNLQVKHFSSSDMAAEYEDNLDWNNPGEIIPFTAASLLTTYLDKVNEDNPNVIDHVINVITGHDKCSCAGCAEDSLQPAQINNDPGEIAREEKIDKANQEILMKLELQLMDLWQQSPDTNKVVAAFTRTLSAETLIEQAGEKAFTIEKLKTGNRITQLKVTMVFKNEPSLMLFFVDNPNL